MPQSKIKDFEKLINSELSSKIKKSEIEFDELLIEADIQNLIDIIKFLKLNEKCKFRQLIDIAGVDFPDKEKRFRLVYLLLSHENNLRIKVCVDMKQNTNPHNKNFPSTNWMEREVFDMYGIKFKNHQILENTNRL